MKIKILQIKKAKTLSGEHNDLTLSSVSLSMTRPLFKEMVSGATPRELETMAQVMNDNQPQENDYQYLTEAGALLSMLNQLTGRSYRARDKRKIPTQNLKLIVYLLKDGRTINEIASVIQHKTQQWICDKKTAAWLRPMTLFRKSNFDCYLNEVVT